MTYARFGATLAGIVSGATLITAPSFMILSTVRILNWQEVILWAVELLGCIKACNYIFKDKQQIPVIAFGYGFFFLYNALAILCSNLSYGIVAWTGLRNTGLVLIVCAAVASYFFVPKMSENETRAATLMRIQARTATLLCIATALAGVSFIYGTWFPLFVIPGALVLADVLNAAGSGSRV